jgi:hypothetical protein
MAITYPTPVVNTTTGDPNVDSLKVGGDNINNAFENIKQEFASVASSTGNSFDDVNDRIDEIDVILDDNVLLANLPKPTIDLDFRNNSYEVWQDDANSFTKMPLADAITITNGGGTLIRPTGIIGSVGANTGRLTTANGRQGLLVEEARTNAVANSGKLDESNWVKVGFDVENDNDLVETSGDSDKRLTNVSPTHLLSGVVGVTAYRIGSVSGMSGRYLILSIGNTTTGGSNRYGIVVDPNTGEVTNSFGIGSTTLSGFGAYRTPDGGLFLWVAGSRNDSDLRNYSLAITTSPSSTTVPSVTGAGARLNDVRVQIEAGSTPSSYIPTTTAAVTRVADNVVRTLGDEINKRRFAIYVEWDNTVVEGITSFVPLYNIIGVNQVSDVDFRGFGISNGSSGRRVVTILLRDGTVNDSLSMGTGILGVNKAVFWIDRDAGTMGGCLNGLSAVQMNITNDISDNFFARLRLVNGRRIVGTISNFVQQLTYHNVRVFPDIPPESQMVALTKGAN